MKIYTRTGDKGTTSLYSGQRVLKNDPAIEAIGSVDECNSSIGFALSLIPDGEKYSQVKEQLIHIQHALFDVGASLATPRTKASSQKIDKTRFDLEASQLLENWMDEMEKTLSPLKTFILPGGHPAGAALHLSRSLCRRAERNLIPLKEHADLSENVFIYMNRLSDYLFFLSRHVNQIAGKEETSWQPHKT